MLKRIDLSNHSSNISIPEEYKYLETSSTFEFKDKGEDEIDDPSDNSDLSESNLVNDSNCEIKSEIEIEEFKL